MLYYLHHFSGYVPLLNVTRYITFRTAGASITALAIGLFLGPYMIRKLREFQVGQVIRQEGPATHRTKAGTPTMGGRADSDVRDRADAAVGEPAERFHLGCGPRDAGVRRRRLRRRLPEDRAPDAITACGRATSSVGSS